jgi:hypothetical protein
MGAHRSACTQWPASSASSFMFGNNCSASGRFLRLMYLPRVSYHMDEEDGVTYGLFLPLMNRAGPSHVRSPGA